MNVYKFVYFRIKHHLKHFRTVVATYTHKALISVATQLVSTIHHAENPPNTTSWAFLPSEKNQLFFVAKKQDFVLGPQQLCLLRFIFKSFHFRRYTLNFLAATSILHGVVFTIDRKLPNIHS